MRKFSMLIAAMAVAASLASCEKNNEPYADRTPNKVAFVERSLSGVTVGSELTDAVEAVDLGLSVKWANMNLGATSATDGGAKYAWAEIKSKESNQHWDGYEYGEFSGDAEMNLTKYCYDSFGENQDLNGAKGNVLHQNDDAAYVAWGEGWRIPTKTEVEELIATCELSKSGSSYKFTAPNGNSITLDTNGVGFWTSSLSESASCKAYSYSPSNIEEQIRCYILNIRPVYTK